MEHGQIAEQFPVKEAGANRHGHPTALGRELARMAVYEDMQSDLERLEAACA